MAGMMEVPPLRIPGRSARLHISATWSTWPRTYSAARWSMTDPPRLAPGDCRWTIRYGWRSCRPVTREVGRRRLESREARSWPGPDAWRGFAIGYGTWRFTSPCEPWEPEEVLVMDNAYRRRW